MGEPQSRKAVATAISKALICEGWSNFHATLAKSVTYVLELISSQRLNTNVIATGSFAEGTETSGSDLDQMFSMSDVTAIKEEESADVSGHVFKMEIKTCRPGFSRLLYVKTDKSVSNEAINMAIKQCIEEYDERVHFSGQKCKEFYENILSKTDKYSTLGDSFCRKHGPCVTRSYQVGPNSSETDVSTAVKCLSWPTSAEEWLTRPRNGYNGQWPSSKMIDTLKNMPCFLLPVGDPSSPHSDLEWRFAFVPAERELIWSFNDTQLHCYIILKLMKQKYFDPIANKQLSSFHLKTVVFWISEDMGMAIWTPENLFHCVDLCLQMIEQSLTNFFLPHYFMKERNLLHSKFDKPDELILAIKKAKGIKDNPTVCVLECLKENVASLKNIIETCLSSDDWTLESFLEMYNNNSDDTKVDKFWSFNICNKTYDTYLFAVAFPFSLKQIIDALHQLCEPPTVLNKEILNGIKFYLNVRMGLNLLAEICLASDEVEKEEMMRHASRSFDIGTHIDGLAGWLHFATFHFICGRPDKAVAILKNICFKRRFLYTYEWNRLRLITIDDFKTVEADDKINVLHARENESGILSRELLSGVPVSRETTFCDVMFILADVNAVPDALKYECALLGKNRNWNFCRVHPMIYAYYLLFEISLKDPSIDKMNVLEQLIFVNSKIEPQLEHHRIYNIIAYCFQKCGYLQHMLWFPIESLKYNPSRGNAAAYHLCINIRELFEKQLRED